MIKFQTVRKFCLNDFYIFFSETISRFRNSCLVSPPLFTRVQMVKWPNIAVGSRCLNNSVHANRRSKKRSWKIERPISMTDDRWSGVIISRLIVPRSRDVEIPRGGGTSKTRYETSRPLRNWPLWIPAGSSCPVPRPLLMTVAPYCVTTRREQTFKRYPRTGEEKFGRGCHR